MFGWVILTTILTFSDLLDLYDFCLLMSVYVNISKLFLLNFLFILFNKTYDKFGNMKNTFGQKVIEFYDTL